MFRFDPAEIINRFKTKCYKNYIDMVNSDHDFYSLGDILENSNPHHSEGSVWTHTCMVCSQILGTVKDPSIELFLAGLLHDIGKPYTRKTTIKENKIDHSPYIEYLKKTTFYDHQNIGVFLAIDALNIMFDGCLDSIDIRRIIELINFHMLFSFSLGIKGDNSKVLSDKDKKILNSIFADNRDLFIDLIDFARCDSLGRITYTDKYISTMIRDSTLKNFFDELHYDKANKDKFPKFIMLIGVPGTGKTTYRKSNIEKFKNYQIISFDDNVEREAVNLGISYTDMFRKDRKDSVDIQKILDHTAKQNTKNLIEAVKAKKNILVDMTNLTKKSRNKKLCHVPDNRYYREAIVFIRGYDDILKTNKEREKIQRQIPDTVLIDQMKRFSIPTEQEFDTVRIILNSKEL